MLQQLHIQNYAIIDSIEINFSPHLNIIQVKQVQVKVF